MKKAIIFLIAVLWHSVAWGQYGYSGYSDTYEAERQRRAAEYELQRQQDQMRRQRDEYNSQMWRMQQEQRRLESDLDYERHRYRGSWER